MMASILIKPQNSDCSAPQPRPGMFQHYLSLLLALALVSWAHGFVPGFLSLQPARHSHPIRRACNFKSLRIAINAEQDSADLEWWEQLGGLPFECTQCGKCCHVKGDVWFSPEETNRILGFLGISEKTFKEKYVNEEIEGWNRYDNSYLRIG
eukprot:761311-Hanusia_phi.AAC.7